MPLLNTVTKQSLQDIGKELVESLIMSQCNYLTIVIIERFELKLNYVNDFDARELEIAEFILGLMDDPWPFKSLLANIIR